MNLKYQSNRSHLLLLALVCLALPAAGSAAPTAKPRIFNKDKPDLSEQLFPLKYFRLDQVWGGVKGHTDGYRAKMTFKTTDGRGILVEINFREDASPICCLECHFGPITVRVSLHTAPDLV